MRLFRPAHFLSLGVFVFIGMLSVTAGKPQSRKDIPTISREGIKAVCLVVVSDSSGKEIKQGSGIVVSNDGKVVTNFHVIDGGSSAIIKFSNGAFFLVEGVLAVDKEKDVAVLKASGADFPFILLADSDKVQVGEDVVSIGSPLSLEATVSNGIISSIRDLGDSNFRVFQTTAPISPGSSGGALLNMQGEVIGVTTFQFTKGQNLNFAIPINIAKPLLAAKSLSKLGDTSNETGQSTTSIGGLPELWTSLTTGHDYKLRIDGDHLYQEAILPPAFQQVIDQGAFLRCDYKREGGKWSGSCASNLPYNCRSVMYGPQVKLCRTELGGEITMLTPTRIEGDADTFGPKDFDCGKCVARKVTRIHFVWIPKK